MTNLSDKFDALVLAQATRDSEIRAKIDAIRGTATLATIYGEIAALRGTGGPENTLRSINQSIWNLAGTAPGASLADLLTALQASATEATSAAILAAIGTLASNPANYTIKDLLALLNTGMDAPPPGKTGSDTGGGTGGGGGGYPEGGPGDGPYQADPGSCDPWGPWDYSARTSGMSYLGTATVNGVTHHIYAPVIMEYAPCFVQHQNEWGTTTYPQNTAAAPRSVDFNHNIAVCVSWDFTGMAEIPIVAGLYRLRCEMLWPQEAESSDFYTFNTYSGCDSVTFGVMGVASSMYPHGVSETRGWRVAVPVGIMPPANMYFHIGLSGSSFYV